MNKIKLKSLMVPSDTTLKEGMQKLNTIGGKILFVVGDREVLLGTVTDGDIRRGLINGLNFSDNIGICSTTFSSIKVLAFSFLSGS